jgi:hypothetical protein
MRGWMMPPAYGLSVYHEDLMVSAGLGHGTFAIDMPGSKLLELPATIVIS